MEEKLQEIALLIEQHQADGVRQGRESYVESYRLAKLIVELMACQKHAPIRVVDLKEVERQQ